MRTEERLRRYAHRVRSLDYHLDKYRHARRLVALRAMRSEIATEGERQEVSFHAVGIAEELDRLSAGGVFP